MIASIRGRLERKTADGVVIAIGGVSIRLQVSLPVTERLGAVGETVELFTSLQIRSREDTISLYGFETDQGRRLFELLLGVTGVGPRNALGLLSAYSPEHLASAITSGSAEVLSDVSGVGKRLAERIIVDLRGRLEKEWGEAAISAISGDGEVIAALTALGYSAAEARAASGRLPQDGELSLEERVRRALQQLGRSG